MSSDLSGPFTAGLVSPELAAVVLRALAIAVVGLTVAWVLGADGAATVDSDLLPAIGVEASS